MNAHDTPAEKAAWINAHGSERLKLALKLNESLVGYDTERLEKEHPGWIWMREVSEYGPVREPDLASLQALDKARAEFPEAVLCVARYYNQHPRYMIRAKFLGGDIVKVLHIALKIRGVEAPCIKPYRSGQP